MRIYAASSWRNLDRVREVVDLLCEAGHQVFDFTRPGEGADLPNGLLSSGEPELMFGLARLHTTEASLLDALRGRETSR